MRMIRVQMNDIRGSVPIRDGYYLLVLADDPEKIVPSELCGGTFYKLEDLAARVLTGTIDVPETYDKSDILEWGKIPE